jgi:hypothetical protein
MILTGFADPDTEKFSSERPPPMSERKSAAALSVPPQAIAGVSAVDESWKDLAPVAPESKR